MWSALPQGMKRERESGQNYSTHKSAVCGDHIDCRRGPEVEHRCGRAVTLRGGDGIRQTIRARRRGRIIAHRDRNWQAFPDKLGGEAKLLLADFHERTSRGGDDRRYGDGGKRLMPVGSRRER